MTRDPMDRFITWSSVAVAILVLVVGSYEAWRRICCT
jgi:hypothetical protein